MFIKPRSILARYFSASHARVVDKTRAQLLLRSSLEKRAKFVRSRDDKMKFWWISRGRWRSISFKEGSEMENSLLAQFHDNFSTHQVRCCWSYDSSRLMDFGLKISFRGKISKLEHNDDARRITHEAAASAAVAFRNESSLTSIESRKHNIATFGKQGVSS